MVVRVDHNVAFIVALATQLQGKLRACIVGRELADSEKDLVGVEVHAVAELEAMNHVALADDA